MDKARNTHFDIQKSQDSQDIYQHKAQQNYQLIDFQNRPAYKFSSNYQHTMSASTYSSNYR